MRIGGGLGGVDTVVALLVVLVAIVIVVVCKTSSPSRVAGRNVAHVRVRIGIGIGMPGSGNGGTRVHAVGAISAYFPFSFPLPFAALLGRTTVSHLSAGYMREGHAGFVDCLVSSPADVLVPPRPSRVSHRVRRHPSPWRPPPIRVISIGERRCARLLAATTVAIVTPAATLLLRLDLGQEFLPAVLLPLLRLPVWLRGERRRRYIWREGLPSLQVAEFPGPDCEAEKRHVPCWVDQKLDCHPPAETLQRQSGDGWPGVPVVVWLHKMVLISHYSPDV